MLCYGWANSTVGVSIILQRSLFFKVTFTSNSRKILQVIRKSLNSYPKLAFKGKKYKVQEM